MPPASAGTSEKARVKVSQKLIDWADVIFVMERKHKSILAKRFEDSFAGKAVIVLNIEDNYSFNNNELLEILKTALNEYL